MRRALFCFLLEAKFLEEKAPDAVQPAHDDTGGDGYYDADDKSDEALLFKPCAPPYDNLDHPVYAGDEKEDYLHKAGQSVEPGHTQLLYIIFAGSAARAVTLQIYYITHFPDVKTRRRENFGAETPKAVRHPQFRPTYSAATKKFRAYCTEFSKSNLSSERLTPAR